MADAQPELARSGKNICWETRRRILIALYAYAYELEQVSLVSDHEYDKLASEIDLAATTGRPDIDAFFVKEYSPHTGMWVRRHPELDKLAALYQRLHG